MLLVAQEALIYLLKTQEEELIMMVLIVKVLDLLIQQDGIITLCF
jgi:hypothetical protein